MSRQRPFEGVGDARIRRRQVLRFTGIGLRVVEFAPGRRDELVAPVAHFGQLAPAVVVARVPCLAKGEQIQFRAASERQQTHALHGGRHLGADQIQNRGHHVDDAHLVGDHADRHTRAGDDQWDVHRRFVDEKAVLLFAVFSQRLTMIANDDDDRAVEMSAGAQILRESAHLRVGRSHLAVVRTLHGRRKSRPIWLGRHVGAVRIVEMHPRKKRLIAFLSEPGQRVVDDLAAWALGGVEDRTDIW
jgi:hypothetical protein